MSRDFFGIVGEFATSPDISQMFGEVHLHGLIASRFMTKGFYGNLNILLDL
jgi:SAM-dependent MidA family methyltransferase